MIAAQHSAVDAFQLNLLVELLECYDEAIFEFHEIRLELGLHLDHVLLKALLIGSEANSEELDLVGVEFHDLLLFNLDVVLVLNFVLHIELIIKCLANFLCLFDQPVTLT